MSTYYHVTNDINYSSVSLLLTNYFPVLDDETRVILNVTNSSSSDYINASYIQVKSDNIVGWDQMTAQIFNYNILGLQRKY